MEPETLAGAQKPCPCRRVALALLASEGAATARREHSVSLLSVLDEGLKSVTRDRMRGERRSAASPRKRARAPGLRTR